MMVRDLRKMKTELLPDDAEDEQNVSMKNMDDFQKQKHLLNRKLAGLTQNISELNELKKKRGGVRDAQIIGMQNDNMKDLQEAEKYWVALKNAFEKNVKKGKLEQKELEARKKFVELYGKELAKLFELNSNVKRLPNQDATSQAIERNRSRAAERAKRRADRTQKRSATRKAATGNETADDDDDEQKVPVSSQEQQFYMEVEEKNKKMDALLDVISTGLKDIQEMAIDIGQNLEKQNEMLKEVDEKMDLTVENYVTANQRLKNLIDENTGGVERWCPIIILVVVLLAIVGYILTLAK